MKLKTLPALLLILLLIKPFKIHAQINEQDSLALVDLYNSTDGPHWTNHTNWLTKKPVGSWHGIVIADKHVTELHLSYNQLSGNIPSSIANLSNATWLDLNDNQLTGNIPSSIGNLSNLVLLYLYDNQLSGSIPSSLGNLSNLTDLDLWNNSLSGNIPATIGSLISLQRLDISFNQLTGNIPSSIGNLTNLKALGIDYNQLKGSIPSVFSNLVKLQHLSFSNNQFSGNIPFSIANLTNLDELSFQNNQFTFSGIESFVSVVNANSHQPYFIYSPQANIPITFNNGKLYVSPGGTLANDTLRWYKVGKNKPVATITGDTSFTPSETGKYYAAATNSVATQLTLYSDTVEVDAVLAATLLHFNAVLQNENTALLQWQTSSETNVDGFEIQRSANAISFTTTGKVPANKNSAGTSSYSYSDNIAGIQAGTIYYRLVVIDKDGTAKPGNIITLNRKLPDAGFTVYPNPATDNVSVVFNTKKAEAYTIQLINAAGKILQTKTGISVAGENKVLINVSGYMHGLYFITLLNNEQGKITLKLNK